MACFISASVWSSEGTLHIPPGCPVTIAIHNNNNNTLTNKPYQHAAQAQEVAQKAQQITKNLHKNLPTLLSSISMPTPSLPTLTDYHEQTKHMLQRYKWWLLGGLCASIYGTLLYISVKGNYYLAHQNKWANWRAHVPLAELVGIPQEELTHHLILEINRQYTVSDNLGDKQAIALDFLQTIKQEEKNLKWYEWWHWLLSTLRISRLCCINQGAYQDITNKYARLNYLNNLFHSWLLHQQF